MLINITIINITNQETFNAIEAALDGLFDEGHNFEYAIDEVEQ